MQAFFELSAKTNTEILLGIRNIAHKEQKLKAEFLVYLNEVDERKIYAREGYSSLFSFLTEHLRYAESSALKRIHVARKVKLFPQIYSLVEEGKVSLSSLELVARHLTPENSASLLGEIVGKSVRQVEHLVGSLFPKPSPKDKVNALSEDSFLITFAADRELMEKMSQGKALLGRKYPSGRLGDILHDAFDLLLEHEGDKRCMPSTEDFPPALLEEVQSQQLALALMSDPSLKDTPRYIPRGIRREVWQRDGGKCQYPRRDGTICGARTFLEFDHVVAWANGGTSHSAGNIQLLCRAHNQLKGIGKFSQIGI